MKFSKDGYKRNSKDRNNPYNIIPSGNITMKDVDFPVFGIDNLGNIEIMMPGGEYKFPGSSVFEIPLAQIGKELSELEKKINVYLNNPGERAKAFSESEEELANIDNLRHAMAGRYTAEELQNKVKGIPYIGSILDATGVDKLVGFLGSNALGIGHEVSTLVEDERPFFAALQETGEDVFNNFVGSIVGSTDASSERKDNMLQFLSYNNLLPDGYVQTDPNFSENVYFKNPDTTIKKPNFDSYQGGGEGKYQVEVIKYPLGYPGMPPGHIESRILNTEDLPEKYKKLDEDGRLIYKPYLNAWPNRNREVDYDPKYDYEPGVQTLILNLNESDLEKYMNASQLSRAGGMEIPLVNYELNTMFGFGNKGQYDFFTDNCADQTCRALGLSDANSSMLGVTTPQQVYDALMSDPRLLAGSVKGDPTVLETAGKSIYNTYRTTPWSLSRPLREKAVNYIEDNTDLQFDWEGVKNIPGYHYRNWIRPTGRTIEKGAKAVKETYEDLSQSFIDGINKINPMNWKNGGSLPKAQNGLNMLNIINPSMFTTSYLVNKGMDLVKNKIADNVSPYGYHDAYNRLYDAIFTTENHEGFSSEAGDERRDLLHMLMGLPQENNTILEQTTYVPTKGHNEGDIYYSSPFTEQEIQKNINNIGKSEKDIWYEDYLLNEKGDPKDWELYWNEILEDGLDYKLFNRLLDSNEADDPFMWNGKEATDDKFQAEEEPEKYIYYKDIQEHKDFVNSSDYKKWEKEAKEQIEDRYNRVQFPDLETLLTTPGNKEEGTDQSGGFYGSVLGNFTLGQGEDEKGKYISYYDKWDLSPYQYDGGWKETLSNLAQEYILGVTPASIYNRMYYTIDDEGNYVFEKKNGGSLPQAQYGVEPYTAVQDNTYVHIPPPPPAPTKVIDQFPHGTISPAGPEPAWYEKLLNVVAHPMEAFGRSIHNQDWWTGDLGEGLPMSPQHSTNIGGGFDMLNTFVNPASWVEDISDSESITEGVVNTAMLFPIFRGGKLVKHADEVVDASKQITKGSGKVKIEDPNTLYRVVDVPVGTSADEIAKAAEYGTTIPNVATTGRRTGYSQLQRETPFDVLNTTSNQGWILGRGPNDPGNLMNLYGGKNPYVIKMSRGNPLVGPETLKTINQRTDILRDFSFPYTQNVGKWNPATGQFDLPLELGAGVFTTVGKSADDLAKIMPGSIVNPNMVSRGNNNITTIFGPKGFQVRQPQEVLPISEYIKRIGNNPNFKFNLGGSLPKAQDGDGYIEQYTTMNQDGVYNPYTLTDEEMAVANKYQPVVDWYDSYLQGDTFNHLYNKILDNTSDPWVPRFMKTGLKQTQQYVQDYPYVKQHNDIWNWDPLNDPVNVAPSIIEKRTNTGGLHRSKASNQTTTKSRISIDPQNEYFGPYSTEQQEGIMAHELGHTEGRFFTGSPELDAEINKRNKAYQRVWNNLPEEDKKRMTENPVEIGYWLSDNYNSSSDFHDAASHEVRSDVIRFRYLADKAGIYNSSGDYKKFNESDLKKMKDQFGNNRLFRHFEDKDIIWLMDNVAQQTPEGTDNPYEIVDDFGQSSFMSRYGGQLPKAQEGKETISFDDLEKGIRYVESLNGELMLNPESSATGLYGQLWNEIKDKYDGTREEFAKDLDYQKQLFKDRANGLIEGVPGLISNGIDLYNEYSEVEHGMSMLEIAALSNMLGRQGTRKYIGNHIRDGRSLESVFPNLYGEDAKYTNKTPGEYIEKFKKGLLEELKSGGEFMKKMNRLKQQLELYNSGKEISGIAKKELELRGLIKQPVMRTGGSVPVKEGDYLGKIARDAGYTLDEVMQFNPQLKDRKDYVIYPGEKIYFDNETREYDLSGKPKLFHTVQRGDTLGEIASKYDLNLTEVAKLNNITGDAINRIYPGDQILLPEHAKFERNDDIKKQEDIAKSPVTNTDSVVVNTPSPVNDIWVEREYDSETGRYKIIGGKKQNIQEINTYNNLQTIIKGKNDFDKSTSTKKIYTVKEGDTLSRIASDFGVPLNTLVTDNNISDPSKILVNQKITVNKNTAKPYLVIDKSKSKMHLIYPGDTQPRESYDILTGTMVGDQATVTKSDYFYQGKKLTQDELNQHMEDNGVKNIRELLSIKLDGKPLYTSSTDYYAGNRMTGAGKYTISETNADGGRSYRGDAAPGELVPSFNLVNEQGVEQALAIHGVTRGRTASLYDNNPYNNRLTSGCINGKCEDLQSLYENPDITKGTEVYVLPENEDSGSSFVYENGKINFYTKRENQERARKGFYKAKDNKNRYSGKGGDEGEFVEDGPGINVTTNFGNYNPIMFEFDKSLHQSEGANNPYVQADGSVINLNKEFTEHTQPFLNSLAENKKRVMETINIDGDLYNDLALVSFGIYANESGMGDINPLGEDILKLGRKTGVTLLNKLGAGLNPVGSGSVERKYNIGFQNDPSNSVGWTQLRVGDGNTGPNEREALARYDNKYDTKFTNKIETVLSQDDLNTLQSYDQKNGTDLYSQATSNNNKGRIYVNRLGEVQYHKYDIDNSLLLDPEYSAIATAIILGERYKNQISRDKKNSSDFDIYHEVAKTWRPGTKSDDYARLVNANIPLVTLRETDINNIDKNVIIKGEYQNTSETTKDLAVEAAHNTVLPNLLSTIFGFSRGGEFGLNNQIQFYKDYVEGLYKNTNQEKSAKKLYDKLNRMYYNEYRGTDSNALDIMNLMNSGTNN